MASGEEYETYEEYQERSYQTLQEIEAAILARLVQIQETSCGNYHLPGRLSSCDLSHTI